MSLFDKLVAFAQCYPGYYQLMFQPPRLTLDETTAVDQDVQLQVKRLIEEWELHLMSLLADAITDMNACSEAVRKQSALFFISSIHGLIDTCRSRALPQILTGIDLIPQDLVQGYISWLLSSITHQLEGAV